MIAEIVLDSNEVIIGLVIAILVLLVIYIARRV